MKGGNFISNGGGRNISGMMGNLITMMKGNQVSESNYALFEAVELYKSSSGIELGLAIRKRR